MKKRIFSIALAGVMGLSSVVPALAVTPADGLLDATGEYANSTGSVVADKDAVDINGVVGKDTTQGKYSQYDVVVDGYTGTTMDETESEVEVYATVAPSYGVKIPKVIILSASGLGLYDIGVKGDMSGAQTLTIAPVDKITDTAETDFYMSEQNAFIGAKDDIVAVVEQSKTEWVWSDINKDNYTWLAEAGVITAEDISAGSWAGVFDFVISMDIEGVNLVNKAAGGFGYWNNTGTLIDATTAKHTDYISVEYGATYKVSNAMPTPLVVLFDENYNFVARIAGTSNGYNNLDKYFTITNENVKYMSINYNAIDEDYIYAYKVNAEDVPEYSTTVGFLGDSITKGFMRVDGNSSGTYFRFANLVARDINSNVMGYGVEGTRIAGSDSTSITNRVSAMSDDLDMVVVMGGVNDFVGGTEAFGTISDVTTDTFYGAMNVLLTTLSEKYENKPIVFLTPLDIYGANYSDTNKTTGKTLDEYVAAIKEVCALYDNVTVIDTHTLSDSVLDASDATLFPDGVHPSQEGHIIIADYVVKELKLLGLA